MSVEVDPKDWWKSRTVIANLAAIIVVGMTAAGFDVEVGVVEVVIITVMNIGLRFATKAPVKL
jgi:hypothetical protein